jgi:hypothetical protein
MATDARAAALAFQLEMLKVEVDTVNATIRQMDEITKNVKQWSIVLWTGAVGGALVTPRLTPFVGATAAIPILFWVVDAWYRVMQRRFVWRSLEIMDFLNDGALEESFERGQLVKLTVLDVGARRSRGAAYRDFTDWRRVIRFREFTQLYGGLLAFSIVIAVAATLLLPSSTAP